jgi:hypothetical protein
LQSRGRWCALARTAQRPRYLPVMRAAGCKVLTFNDIPSSWMHEDHKTIA